MLQCTGCGGTRKYKYISKKVENITKEKYRTLRKSGWFYNEENDVWKNRVVDLDNWDHTCNCHQGCLPTIALLILSSIASAFII
jgi:hypothetical protein